jgi:hypothetical protein
MKERAEFDQGKWKNGWIEQGYFSGNCSFLARRDASLNLMRVVLD